MEKAYKYILAIETSCDDSACAIIAFAGDNFIILGDIIIDQNTLHKEFGGIVPDIAACAHLEMIDKVIESSMQMANDNPYFKNKDALRYKDIDYIAVTNAPGLIGSLNIGLAAAKGISIANSIPLIAIHHLEAHLLSPLITENITFPFIFLLVSGGHTQLIRVNAIGDYQRIGTTLDDAAGEIFDKIANFLDLGLPGGEKIEKMAQGGNPISFIFPTPLEKTQSEDDDFYNFSFSGLKTALIREGKEFLNGKRKYDIHDFTATCQNAIISHLVAKTKKLLLTNQDCKFLTVGGGVAKNTLLRKKIIQLAKENNIMPVFPPLRYCTDNAVMIGFTAYKKYFYQNINYPKFSSLNYDHRQNEKINENLRIFAKSRMPLTENSSGKIIGTGKKGRKV